MMSDPAEELQARYDELFANLPEDEVGDDEPLVFASAGAPTVRTGGAIYVLWGGATWRFQLEDGRGVFTEFRDRRPRRRVVDPAGEPGLN